MKQSVIAVVATAMSLTIFSAFAGKTIYVAVGGSDSNGGTGWDDAYLHVQYAVNQAAEGDEVLIGDGCFGFLDKTTTPRILTVSKAITIRSLNGPGRTFLDAGTANADQGLAKITADAYISGICFSNGYNITKGNTWSGKGYISGVDISAGILSNCVIHCRTAWASWILKASGTAKIRNVHIAKCSGITTGADGGCYAAVSGSVDVDGLIVDSGISYASTATVPFQFSEYASIRNFKLLNFKCGGAVYNASYKSLVTIAGSVRLADSTIAGCSIKGDSGILSLSSNKGWSPIRSSTPTRAYALRIRNSRAQTISDVSSTVSAMNSRSMTRRTGGMIRASLTRRMAITGFRFRRHTPIAVWNRFVRRQHPTFSAASITGTAHSTVGLVTPKGM